MTRFYLFMQTKKNTAIFYSTQNLLNINNVTAVMQLIGNTFII